MRDWGRFRSDREGMSRELAWSGKPMRQLDILGLRCMKFLLCAVVLASGADSQASQGMAACEQATWFAPNPVSGGAFGYRVAVSGDTALIAVFQENHIGILGEVHAYVRTSGQWAYQSQITTNGTKWGDQFGADVAAEKGTAVIGAPGDDTSAINGGAVYVFERISGVWKRRAKLFANDAQDDDQLGFRLSYSGARVAVGTYHFPSAPEFVYIFSQTGTSWSQDAKLAPSQGHVGDGFALSISMDGDTILVGAPLDNAAGILSGAAYVFVRSPSGWVQEARLTPGHGLSGTVFGSSVAVHGNTAVIGAPRKSFPWPGGGSVHVFERTGTTWIETAELTASNGKNWKLLGAAVSIEGDTIIAGAPGEGSLNPEATAHVFTRNGSSWSELEIKPPLAGDFGYSVAQTGDTVVIGEPYGYQLGGHARVYLLHQAWPRTAWPRQTRSGVFRPLASSGARVLPLRRDSAFGPPTYATTSRACSSTGPAAGMRFRSWAERCARGRLSCVPPPSTQAAGRRRTTTARAYSTSTWPHSRTAN